MRLGFPISVVVLLASIAAAPTSASPVKVLSAADATKNTDAAIKEGYSAEAGATLVSSIIGAHVYSSTAADADDIGAITDIVLDQNGDVQVVVLGVGGFLGIGQRSVAVDSVDFKVQKGGADGKDRFILKATKAAFAAAPSFSFGDAQALPNPGGTVTDQPTETAQTLAPAPGPLDRSKMRPLDITKIKADDFKGAAVVGPAGEQIGTISDLVLDKSSKIDAVIVNVGGVVGLGTKPVAVAFDLADYSTDKDGRIYLFIRATNAQLEAQPSYDKATYAAQRSEMRLARSKALSECRLGPDIEFTSDELGKEGVSLQGATKPFEHGGRHV
jgi:sporulation protein YlmC with PRC-barrel domain